MPSSRAAAKIADPWGEHTPYGPGEPWPVRVDQHLADGVAPADVERWVQTASLLHSNGDAMDVAVRDGRLVACAAVRRTGSTAVGSTSRTPTPGRPTARATG